MNWKNITAKELHKMAVKIDLEPTKKRRAKHPIFWYYIDGKRELRIKLPNIHGGSGSISTGFLQEIKRSLLLTSKQFCDLVECPMRSKDYEAIIREKLNL